MSNDDLIKKADIEAIAEKGAKIYKRIKKKYEPKHNGKFLAIDPESGNAYMAKFTSDAVEQGRKEHPNTVFYVVKIGFSAAEQFARLSRGRL